MYILIYYSDIATHDELFETLKTYDAVEYVGLYPHRIIIDRNCCVRINGIFYDSEDESDTKTIMSNEDEALNIILGKIKLQDRKFLKIQIVPDTNVSDAVNFIENLSLIIRHQK